MSDYKSILQSHNSELQELINMANKLPDKVEGVQLNFEVVGGMEQPTNPTENMIWVNTDVEISNWIFATAEPETHEEGMVWIFIGTSSTVEFNILQENGVYVYPICAKQYVSGAWIDVTAKSYQNGAWVDWMQYYYSKGNEFNNITSGWVATKYYSLNEGTVEKLSDGIALYDNGIVITNSAIKITKGTIKIKAIGLSGCSGNLYVGLGTAASYNFSVVSQSCVTISQSDCEVTLDVADQTGKSYHIFVLIHGTGAKLTDVYAE